MSLAEELLRKGKELGFVDDEPEPSSFELKYTLDDALVNPDPNVLRELTKKLAEDMEASSRNLFGTAPVTAIDPAAVWSPPVGLRRHITPISWDMTSVTERHTDVKTFHANGMISYHAEKAAKYDIKKEIVDRAISHLMREVEAQLRNGNYFKIDEIKHHETMETEIRITMKGAFFECPQA